ncbi:subtilisin-like protein [Lactarius hatsudake]|nr:subtilisin-like protein [Lactarius hatsudake]
MHYLRLSVLCALTVITTPLDSAATLFPPNWNDMHTKHRWNTIPGKWETIGQPPVGTTIDLSIALRPHREHALTGAIHEVSNPKHPKYGAYLSKEQVAKLVAPHPYTLELVETWLGHHGVSPSNVSTSHGGNRLTVTGVPVSTANELLGTSYQLYRYAGTNETILRTVGYALPVALHVHVQTVAPTTYFGSPLMPWKRAREHRGRAAAALSTRDVPVTPALLRSLYNSVTFQPAATEQNMIGVTGNAGSTGYDPNKLGSEADLDMQYTQGIAWPTPHVFYSIGGSAGKFIPDNFTPVNSNEPFLGWFEVLISVEEVPQTISTSYSGDEQTIPPDYATSVSAPAASAQSSRVVTGVLTPGTAGKTTAPTLSNFSPSSLRHRWRNDGTPRDCRASLFGGFSNVFKRPDYQTDAVLGFFQQLGNQHSGLCNASSRGFPDVSAQAVDFVIVVDDELFLVDGTSCSAPNRPVLDFLNPWLYGTASQGFSDITSGSNPGCGTDGFSAVPGWDPVTGLGTPDFQRLLARLPIPIPIPTSIPTN